MAGGGWGITNLDSGKCLDAQWSHSNSTTLVRYDCYAGATQQWHG
ncbi:RICIN domain-containing protein [Streptomyces sp. NBC_00433]